MENKKKSIVIAISVLLVLVGVVCEILGYIEWAGYFYLTPELVSYVAISIATLYYVLVGYKKPHGNLLRWTFLLLALTCINGIINNAMALAYLEGYSVNVQLFIIGFDGITVLLVSYIAGRLDKIKKNYIPMIVVTVTQVVKSILYNSLYNGWVSFAQIICYSSICLLWIVLMVAYIIRYKEHKEAGLADK